MDNTLRHINCYVKDCAVVAASALGVLLRTLRDQRKLSLRELAQLADIDHAYIYRLETGDKESPSEEALTKLLRALKANKREADMARYLGEHSEVDSDLVVHVLNNATVTYEEFASVASMAFRSTVRRDYAKLIERVRRFNAEDDD